jgi:hypothetical protein
MALFCTECGGQLPEGVRFCPNCGRPVAAPAPSGQASTQPTPTSAQPSPAAPSAPPAPHPSAGAPTTTPPAPRPSIAQPQAPEEDGLGGLAKKWLKTQFNVTLDPHEGRRQDQQARQIEHEMRDRVDQRIGQTAADVLIPQGWKDKMSELEAYQAQGKVAEEQRRREKHAARPRAQVQLVFSGEASGTVAQAIPVEISRPEEPGQALVVSLDPLVPIPFGAHVLYRLVVAVPHYAGQGDYDLAAYEQRDDWDGGEWFQMTLDSEDESFYWTTDYGPGVVTVDADERTLRIRLAMQDSGSRAVHVDGVITLP